MLSLEHSNFVASAGWQCITLNGPVQFIYAEDLVMTRKKLVGATMGLATGALLVSGQTAQSQMAPQQPPQPPPMIVVSGEGIVETPPDRVRIQVGVETQATLASKAGEENNRKQTEVLKAIRGLGIPASQIQTLNYSVSPNIRYDDKLKRQVIDGYRVSNIVQVETEKLEQAGRIIDAALANGANRVAGLDFFVKDDAKARELALTKAVESAKRRAELVAKAAGGGLGELIELSVEGSGSGGGNFYGRGVAGGRAMSMAESTPAPISERTITVSASVSARWKFEPRP